MKKIIVFSLAIVMTFTLANFVHANNDKHLERMTARSYGLGGAFTGLADDVSAVLFNPAGLAQSGIVGFQVSGGISDLKRDDFEKLSDFAELLASDDKNYDDLVNATIPETSVNLQGFAGANLKSIALSGNINTNIRSLGESSDYKGTINEQDITGIVTFASNIVSPPQGVGALSYGFNLKMTQHTNSEYKINLTDREKVEKKTTGNSIAVDGGVLAKLTDIFSVGAQIENLYATDYKMEGTKVTSVYDVGTEEWIENEPEDIASNQSYRPERNMRVGAALEVPLVGIKVSADLENISIISENDNTIYHLGVQKDLMLGLFSIRAGTYGPMDDGFNSVNSKYTAGVSANLTKIHIDAAVGSDRDGENITGILSGRIKF